MNILRIEEFETYLKRQILPAAEDLENLADASRKHVQKLVYTNLVDRFDAMIDRTLLDNCRLEYLQEKAEKGLNSQMSESDLLKLLMRSEDLQAAVDDRLQAAIRNSILRERHSKKLLQAWKAFDLPEKGARSHRVNISTGEIMGTMKVQQETIPYSILGYSDWLYSRRNGVVHGAGGSKFLANDRIQIKKLYKVSIAKTFRIKPASIKMAAQFYLGLVNILKAECEAPDA